MMRWIIVFILIVLNFHSKAQIVINEISASNADQLHDPDFFNFSSWIELHNAGTSAVNVNGYGLSDDPSIPTKWRINASVSIPSKGYLLIWCDNQNTGLHTNFELRAEGEEILLTNSSGAVIDRITYPQLPTNINYGRLPDGSSNIGLLSNYSPTQANTGVISSSITEEPTFNVESGRYTSTQSVTLLHSQSNAQIRFTTNGSEPTESSTLYTSPLSINGFTTVKAKAFVTGQIPSKTVFKTYIINQRVSSLPVIAISTNPAYLYDNTIGIYTRGSNGSTGYCQDVPANWNRDWSRHADFEFFDETGKAQVAQAVEIRIGGNCSRTQPQKSLVVKARNKFGSNIINYQFFENKDIHKFGGLMLRNSGNDFNVSMFRDAFMQYMPVDYMDVDYMEYKPAVLYLNGQYMGIIDIREKIDSDFIESNYGIKSDDLDLLETYTNALDGTNDAYLNYLNALANMNRSTPEAFQFINQNIDVQEYINYLVTQIYIANLDWPGNNMKFWRQRSTSGKFRWILWDTDFGFDLYYWAPDATHPTLNFATEPNGPGWPNPPWSTAHIRMVLENPTFRSRFISTMQIALNSAFAPTRLNQLIDTYVNKIAAEVPFHKQRWGGNINDWDFEVNRLRNYANLRSNFMHSHLQSFFGLSNNLQVQTSLSNGEGKINLNQVKVKNQTMQVSQGTQMTAKALPDPGFAFKEWQITTSNSTPVPLIAANDNWLYHDDGVLPAADWQNTNYNDASWKTGQAELGYGEGDENTIISFGPDAGNKHITYYFRKKFTINNTTGLTDAQASIKVDDGAIVYCNGVEVFRYNLPSGTIQNNTLALQNATENVMINFTIPAQHFQNGNNVIAVEVHQISGTSSDVSFLLEANAQILGAVNQTTSTNPEISLQVNANVNLVAVLQPGVAPLTGLKINEVNAKTNFAVRDNFNEPEDFIEIINTSNQVISLQNLYITDNLSVKDKHQILSNNPSELEILPGLFKILWADEDTNQGATHLSFKLSDNGEAVGLYQKINDTFVRLDEFVFSAQTITGSFSRIPDGEGEFLLSPTATPGATNTLTTSIEEQKLLTVYPNPVDDWLSIESESFIQEITLYNSNGVPQSVEWNPLDKQINLKHLTQGLYLLHLTTPEKRVLVKLIKR